MIRKKTHHLNISIRVGHLRAVMLLLLLHCRQSSFVLAFRIGLQLLLILHFLKGHPLELLVSALTAISRPLESMLLHLFRDRLPESIQVRHGETTALVSADDLDEQCSFVSSPFSELQLLAQISSAFKEPHEVVILPWSRRPHFAVSWDPPQSWYCMSLP